MLKIPKKKLIKLSPKVFLITFKLRYDLGLFFLFPQEFYESPKYKNKLFDFDEYMRWYSLEQAKPKDTFYYMTEFQGFNLPGHIIKAWKEKVDDDVWFQHTSYSQEFYDTIPDILDQNDNDWNFYLIGVAKNSESDVLRHEICHGLFYTNASYKKEMMNLIASLEYPVYDHLIWALNDAGYGANFHDEIQAYMTAGLRDNMSKELLNPVRKQFQQVFKKYHKSRVPAPKNIA